MVPKHQRPGLFRSLGRTEELEPNIMSSVQDWINRLNLIPHPEGGYYQRIYTSPVSHNDSPTATSIHYLLEAEDFSAWHRIQQDELWFFHEGRPLIIRQLLASGQLIEHELGGTSSISLLVPANTWFCAEPITNDQQPYSLVSCVVTPGFDFKDFELGNADELVNLYPQHRDIICRLCRDGNKSS